MLAVVRRNLDESSASFWTDAEIYEAITEGQRQVANFVLTVYKTKRQINPLEEVPEALRKLITKKEDSVAGTSDTLPTDFLYCLDVEYGTFEIKYPAYNLTTPYLTHSLANTYLSSTRYYRITDTEIIFDNGSGTVYWTLIYLKTPTDIDGSTQPVLGELTHEAVCTYATAEMLNKDQNFNEASLFMNKFFKLTAQLI